jgi:hypothetical protein
MRLERSTSMKKLTVLTMVMASLLCAGSAFVPSHAQDPAKDDKPTFYRLTPGVYVNGWPRFTIHYSRDWVERLVSVVRGGAFTASSPGGAPNPAIVRVVVTPYVFPLDEYAGEMVKFYDGIGMKDVTLVSDKPTQLRGGTPAREVEIRMVANSVPRTDIDLATRKGDMLIFVSVQPLDAKIGEDLKAILSSIEFEPAKDKPIKLPPDVQGLLDRHCSACVAHDLAKVMVNYSDRYLNSGDKKGEAERHWKQLIGSITACEIGITDLVAVGDKPYLTGFVTTNFGKMPLRETSIIKENGEWKWYGNQRDVVPDPRFQ